MKIEKQPHFLCCCFKHCYIFVFIVEPHNLLIIKMLHVVDITLFTDKYNRIYGDL
jgi:hypothetical protein